MLLIDSGGQFNDRGHKYKTVIFYHDEKQKELNISKAYPKSII